MCMVVLSPRFPPFFCPRLYMHVCVGVHGYRYTLYIFTLSLHQHLFISMHGVDLRRLLTVCHWRICARLTSCHCTLLFLTSILLSAFSPSIIHGWVQTFVFSLNNWLKAWSGGGGRSPWVKERDKRSLRNTCPPLSFPLSLSQEHSRAVVWVPGWLKIPRRLFSSAHLSPSKVDLTLSSYTLFSSTAPPLLLTPE